VTQRRDNTGQCLQEQEAILRLISKKKQCLKAEEPKISGRREIEELGKEKKGGTNTKECLRKEEGGGKLV